MNTVQFIKSSLENNKGWLCGLVQDMADAPLTRPTPNGGNHPWWVLGHVVVSEAFLLDCCLEGKPNRYEAWREHFGNGTTPSDTGEGYPSLDELFAAFDAVRADALTYIDSLSEGDLDQKSQAPEEYGPMFSTVHGVLAAMIGHPYMHSGQVADARKAAGRGPLML